jgi:hypothetical protein
MFPHGVGSHLIGTILTLQELKTATLSSLSSMANNRGSARAIGYKEESGMKAVPALSTPPGPWLNDACLRHFSTWRFADDFGTAVSKTVADRGRPRS